VLLGRDEVSIDRLFPQRPACFEAMQTVYEDEAVTIASNQDGCLLSDFKDTLCDLLDCLWLERCTALYRHVDVRDRKFFSPHHGTSPKGAKENILSPREKMGFSAASWDIHFGATGNSSTDRR